VTEALLTQLALLPDYLSRHLLLSVTALVIGIGISLPLAIVATRVRMLRTPLLTVASAIQTVPSLALLALMVPLLREIGFLPAVIALILYSMLPVMRNTVTGIDDVDADLVEAGTALGMTPRQLLLRVQLPLAMPVIIAGIRTATVWVVGIATLSTPVGATSLGNYIFSGLQTQNYTAVLVGCAAAAVLALLLDGLIRLAETGAARRARGRIVAAAALTAAVLAAGLSPLWLIANTTPSGREIVIGTKTFTEQYILAELIGQRLRDAGYETRTVESLGSTVAFDALVAGQIDVYVDYTGTLWANQMKREEHGDADSVLAAVRSWLSERHGIEQVIPLGFENAYALAMDRGRAAELGITTIGELIVHTPDMTIGGDYEFFDRPEWSSLADAYALRFRDRISMDSSLMYQAVAAGEVDVISAFSTDGRIAAFDLAVLDDRRQALPPYDAVLLVGPGVPDAARGVFESMAGSITTPLMRAANRAVDLDGRTVSDAATALIRKR